jgi:AraC-like DNA-binding protein
MVKLRHTSSERIVAVGWRPRRPSDQVEVMQLSELARHVPRGVIERMEFHIFVLYLEGRCDHEVDFESHACRPGTLLYVRPGQVHRFGLTKEVDGLAVLVAPTFLLPRQHRRGDPWHEGFFDDFGWPTHLQLGPSERAETQAQLERVRAITASETSSNLELALVRYVLACSLLGLAHARGMKEAASEQGTPEQERARRFRAAVERSFRVTRRVEDYAQNLGCSTRTLDRSIQATLGVSAKTVIDERVVLEAKRALVHGRDTVATIGEQLGFSEPTNFVKFFRARTGEAPGSFRLSQLQQDERPATPANQAPPVRTSSPRRSRRS